MKTLALQLLPLLVFIVVDALVDDVRISIASAVLFAIVQLAITWRRTKRFDWFVVLDVALIVTMGGISIAFDDELFFKLKPAIIEGVSIVMMIALLFTSDRFLAGYVGRMAPQLELKPGGLGPVRKLLGGFAVYIALHAAAVLYTALYTSKGTWAFVSGPGFYVALVPLFGVMLLRNRKPHSD